MSYESNSVVESQIINDLIIHKLTANELLIKYPFRLLIDVLDKAANHPEFLSERARRMRKECLKLRPIDDYPELYI